MKKRLSLKISVCIMLVLLLTLGGISLVYIGNNKSLYIEKEKERIVSISDRIESFLPECDRKMLDTFLQKNDYQMYYIVICDSSYDIVYSSNRLATAKLELRKKPSFFEEFTADGNPEYVTTSRYQLIELRRTVDTKDGRYYVVIEESMRISDSVFAYTNKNLLILMTVFVIMSTAAVFILVSRSTKPLKNLCQVAENIANEDYSIRYEGKIPKDEIGILALRLNEMADTIQENIGKLSNYNFLLSQEVARMSEYENLRKKVLTNVSHELKTPLAVISSQVEMMKCSADGEKRDYYYNSAMQEITDMSKLISSLLKFSLNEKKLFQGTVEKTDLSELVTSLCTRMKALMASKNIHFTTQIEKCCYATLSSESVVHVFNNYIMNAFNHTPNSGAVRVSLKMRNGAFRLSVFNEGEPIKKESLDKIWTDFYSAEDKAEDFAAGSGVGLFIVKEIAAVNKTVCGARNLTDGVEFWFDFTDQEG